MSKLNHKMTIFSFSLVLGDLSVVQNIAAPNMTIALEKFEDTIGMTLERAFESAELVEFSVENTHVTV